jgi:lipoprotein-anchoring transpeptidase ErfK/SrfK
MAARTVARAVAHDNVTARRPAGADLCAAVVFASFTFLPAFSFNAAARGGRCGRRGMMECMTVVTVSMPGRLYGVRAIVLGAAVVGVALAGSLMATAPAVARPDAVAFRGDYAPGTVVVNTRQRKLYLVVEPGRALRYPVGVGKAGKQWSGATRINGKYRNPAWSPPADVKRDNPSIPDVIPGGSPANPMGVAAMTLAGGEYAIHGTNRPGSVGGFVSYGCIRMYNEDITDLYARVAVGTPVVVVAR